MSLSQRLQDQGPVLAGWLTVLAIGGVGTYIHFVDQTPQRWLATGLIGVFALLNGWFMSPYCDRNPQANRLILATLAAIVVGVSLLSEQQTFYVIWYYVLGIDALMAFPSKTAIRWIGVFALLTVVILGAQLGLQGALINAPIYLAGFLFFVSFGRLTADAESARQKSEVLLEKLRKTHQQLQEFAAQSEELAVSEERNRLAREMHDTLGHRLTVAAVQLEGAQRLVLSSPDKARQMISTVREQVRTALKELRLTVTALREPLETDLPLPIALKQLVAVFEEATDIDVHLMLPAPFPGLPEVPRLALFRAAQEALTNIQRHADAKQVWLQVACLENKLTLRVSDDGQGLPEQTVQPGFGLIGLRERATRLGGHFEIGPRPGGGIQLIFQLPLEREASGA